MSVARSSSFLISSSVVPTINALCTPHLCPFVQISCGRGGCHYFIQLIIVHCIMFLLHSHRPFCTILLQERSSSGLWIYMEVLLVFCSVRINGDRLQRSPGVTTSFKPTQRSTGHVYMTFVTVWINGKKSKEAGWCTQTEMIACTAPAAKCLLQRIQT